MKVYGLNDFSHLVACRQPCVCGLALFAALTTIASAEGLRNPIDLQVPDYAVITSIGTIDNCETGEIYAADDSVVAVWNPTEILDGFRPYGLVVDESTLAELATTHPAAAFIVGLRRERDGLVVAAPDMHHMNGSIDAGEFSTEYALATFYSDADEPFPELSPLLEQERFHYEFQADFSGERGPELLIRSWISDESGTILRDVKETVVALDSGISHESPVIASGGYLAPVHRVAGFHTSQGDDR